MRSLLTLLTSLLLVTTLQRGDCATQGGAASPADEAVVGAVDEPLVCALNTRCVNSLEGGQLPLLRDKGTPAQALAVLRATPAEFPEARSERAGGLVMAVVFTTPAGFNPHGPSRFKERVDF